MNRGTLTVTTKILGVVIGMVTVLSLGLAAISAAAAGPNLVVNSDLEQASATASIPQGWTKDSWGTITKTFTYPVSGNGSTKAAKVQVTRRTTGDAKWMFNHVPVSSTITYTYSDDYLSNVTTNVTVEYKMSNGTYKYVWIGSAAASGSTWKTFTAQIKPPTGAVTMSVMHLLDRVGTLTLDNVSVAGPGTTPPPPPPAPKPTITSFIANPASIATGSSTVLGWGVSNASSTSINQGVGTVTGSTKSVSPTQTTTYVLTATNPSGSVTATTTVTVVQPPPPPPAPKPTISSFTANPTTVLMGSSTTLSWAVSNASSTSINQGVGTVTGTSRSVSPTATTTYTLTATNPQGSVTAQVIVGVQQPPPPPPPSTPGAFSEGMVTFSFDDSWLSQYTTALPILEAAGIKGTFYLTTEPIESGWSGFITPAQANDYKVRGHDIAGHTVTHTDLTTLSSQALTAELVNSRNYLQSITGVLATSLAYPYGSYNTTVKTAAKNAGYTTARSVEEDTLNLTSTDRFVLKGLIPEINTSMSQIKAAIDEAKAKKQWLIIGLHEIDNSGGQYTNTPAQLQEIVNYVKAANVKTVTVLEGSALMTP